MEEETQTELLVTSGKRVSKAWLGLAVISFLALLAIAGSTSPGSGGPMIILLFLLAVFGLACGTTGLVLRGISSRILGKAFSDMRLIYTAVTIGFGIVFLVGLQTLRQLQLLDIILVAVFELILNFYILRRF